VLGVSEARKVLVTTSSATEVELVAVQRLGGLNPSCIDQTRANLIH
jgi:hypothetical protein